MTRSEMVKLLGHAASALKALPKGTSIPADGQSNPQLKVDVLQLILQILQAILAEQGQQKASDALTADDHALLDAVSSIMDSIKQDQAGLSVPNVQIGGVQIDILQLIIQIITAVLSQQKAPPAAVEKSAETLSPEAIHPLVTTDSITYAIDTLGRLTKLTYASGHVITFNYDAAGNRTSVVTT